MYTWVVFLHLVGVFGFLMAHGVSAAVALRLRKEREVERVRALLDLSSYSIIVMGISFILLLVTGIIAGIIAGFMGDFWGNIWIWASGGTIVVLAILMAWLGTEYYDRVRRALGLPRVHGSRNETLSPPFPLLKSWTPC